MSSPCSPWVLRAAHRCTQIPTSTARSSSIPSMPLRGRCVFAIRSTRTAASGLCPPASQRTEPVHDIRVLREQVDLLKDGMRRRGVLETLAPVLERAEVLERERRTSIQAVEERKAARNASSQEVARRKKAGESADDLIAKARALGEEIARLEGEL